MTLPDAIRLAVADCGAIRLPDWTPDRRIVAIGDELYEARRNMRYDAAYNCLATWPYTTERWQPTAAEVLDERWEVAP